MPVITVKNVAKKFKVYYDRAVSLKEKILFRKRNSYKDRWVLNDISFEVEKGEAIGIIGQNGCGKSTMLKLMTQIMYPDKGSIEIKGRISSLIELGAGFHPDMSGRENIYTNASIFGLTRKEINKRVEQIIDFSEIREFIDNPVRTYSSGMYMRLAFSVAIHVDADILLIDEILAVGDASFQAKCFNKMREIKASGVTIVIVSHGLDQIEQLCKRSIWIEGGYIKKQGAPFDVHPEYLEYMGQKSQPTEQVKPPKPAEEEIQKAETQETEPSNQSKNRWGNRDIEIVSVTLLDENGNEKNLFKTDNPMTININYKVNKPVNNPFVEIGVFRNDGLHCYGTNTLIDRISIPEMTKDSSISFCVNKNNLLAGEYFLDAAIHGEDRVACDYFRNVSIFKMYSSTSDTGVCRLGHEWIL
jgi:ABC-2 type transport system ATP-binding protein